MQAQERLLLYEGIRMEHICHGQLSAAEHIQFSLWKKNFDFNQAGTAIKKVLLLSHLKLLLTS
jgi:hypothetical protein